VYEISRDDRTTRGAFLPLALAALLIAAAPALPRTGVAAGADGAAPQAGAARTPKLREIAELPDDYLGKEFTHTVWLTTTARWMERGGSGDFFFFVQDSEGTQLPNRGFTPSSSLNILRFVLPREDGRKLIDQLTAGRMYEARIRFRIDRQKDLFGQNWEYFARINSVELSSPLKSR